MAVRGPDGRLLRKAALAGVGLALLPVPLIRDDLRAGALVPVLPDHVGDNQQVSLVFVDREYIEPKVRVFIDRAVPTLQAAYGSQCAGISR